MRTNAVFGDPSARLSVSARMRLAADRRLGVGNFLDRTLSVAPAPDRPYLWAQDPADPGRSQPLSLLRLREIRDGYASWYHAAGVRAGDPVGVYCAEGIPSFLHFLGLNALGAVPTLVNGRMDPVIAARYLDRVGVRGIVTTPERRRALTAAGPAPGFLAEDADLPTTRSAGDRLPVVYPYPHADRDPVMLCHTSGTTGLPKATMFGHRQFFLGKRHRLWRFPAGPGDRMLSALPHSHSAGISYLMTATLRGLPTWVMSDLSGPAVVAAMGAVRPTVVVAFPQTYAELAHLDLDRRATADVHTWINTGDSAHEAHIRALVRHGHRPDRRGSRPGSRFIDGLGSSEMGMALFTRVSEPETSDYNRCVGRPIGIVRRAVVLDEDNRELGPGTPGRLGVRTPTVTPGYWNDTALTQRSMFSGYWLTGDVVRRDEAGRFFHLDRVPDVIHTLDGPVYSLPMEEAVLAGCPEVADCAVVAVPDGPVSVPYATVVLRPGVTPPVDPTSAVNAALSARGLARVAGARVATGPDDFPTGPTGKVLKRNLREHLAGLLGGPAADGSRPSAVRTGGPAADRTSRAPIRAGDQTEGTP